MVDTVTMPHGYATGHRPVFCRSQPPEGCCPASHPGFPMADNGHPQIELTPQAVTRLRVWMVDRRVPGTAEAFIGGLLLIEEGVIDDDVIGWCMEYIDQLIALHGPRWHAVLQLRADGTDNGVLPIEPRLN